MEPVLIAKIKWIWNRLNCMSIPEIIHRIWSLIKGRLERGGYFNAILVPLQIDSIHSKFWMRDVENINRPDYRVAAEILDGKLDVFALRGVDVGHPPEWNRDPLTGKLAPLIFGMKLNYRDQALVGDIKYLWEPNRHLQFVILAQAYKLNGGQCYLDGLAVQLKSWFNQCPYPMGHLGKGLILGGHT